MQGALLLDVVVGEGAPVLQLLPREDETLLVRRDTFLVLRQIHERLATQGLIPESWP